MATLVLGGAGALIGSSFGGPAGAKLGLQIGMAVGSVVDSVLAMPKTETGKVSDLRIGGSAYGTAITRGWGEFRTPGLIIYAAEDSKGDHLKKHKGKSSGGGSGGAVGGGGSAPYYTATIGVAFAQGSFYARDPLNPLGGAILYRAIQPLKLWADDQLVFDATTGKGTLKLGQNFFWYPGSETQAPDPTIVAKSGGVSSRTNAFRGLAYGVMVDMNLQPFGNRVPNWSAIVATSPVTLGDVFSDYCRQVGLQPSQIDATAATTPILGFMEPNRAAPQNALAPVCEFFAHDVLEIDGRLSLKPRGGDVVATIPAGDLGASSGGSGAAKMRRKRVDPMTLPGKVEVTYFDRALNHQSGNQSETNQSADVYSVETVSLPLTMEAADAQAGAGRRLDSRWAEIASLEFSLPLRWLRLAPGDPVVMPIGSTPTRVRLTEVNHGPISEIRCAGVPEEKLASVQTGVGSAGGGTQAGPTEVVPSAFVAWSGLEVRNEDQAAPGLYVAASGGGNAAWGGGQAWYTSNGSDWIAGPFLTDAATFGVTTSTLGDGSAANAWDDSRTFGVDVSASGGDLESASDSAILDGGDNHALVGGEVLAFGAVDMTGAERFTLSHLRRGERSSPMTGHATGERFVALATAVARITVPEALVGQTVQVKVVSPGQTLADVSHVETVTIAPRTLTEEEQVLATIARPRFVSPVVLASGGPAAMDWQTVDLSAYVPVGAQAVMLQVAYNMHVPGDTLTVETRPNEAGLTLVAVGVPAIDSSEDGAAGTVDVNRPLSSTASARKIDVRRTGNGGIFWEVRLIGYWG